MTSAAPRGSLSPEKRSLDFQTNEADAEINAGSPRRKKRKLEDGDREPLHETAQGHRTPSPSKNGIINRQDSSPLALALSPDRPPPISLAYHTGLPPSPPPVPDFILAEDSDSESCSPTLRISRVRALVPGFKEGDALRISNLRAIRIKGGWHTARDNDDDIEDWDCVDEELLVPRVEEDGELSEREFPDMVDDLPDEPLMALEPQRNHDIERETKVKVTLHVEPEPHAERAPDLRTSATLSPVVSKPLPSPKPGPAPPQTVWKSVAKSSKSPAPFIPSKNGKLPGLKKTIPKPRDPESIDPVLAAPPEIPSKDLNMVPVGLAGILKKAGSAARRNSEPIRAAKAVDASAPEPSKPMEPEELQISIAGQSKKPRIVAMGSEKRRESTGSANGVRPIPKPPAPKQRKRKSAPVVLQDEMSPSTTDFQTAGESLVEPVVSVPEPEVAPERQEPPGTNISRRTAMFDFLPDEIPTPVAKSKGGFKVGCYIISIVCWDG